MGEKINYDEYFYLDKDFREMVTNKETLRKTLPKFLDNVIDDITLGVIFEIHRKHRMVGLDSEPDLLTTATSHRTAGVEDIFGYDNLGKIQDNCDCPNCNRVVSASKFTAHLENCMGLGRRTNRSRGKQRNNGNGHSSNSNNSAKDREEDLTYSSLHSDDGDDDDDWNSRQKKQRRKHRNKGKRGKGTPNKKGSNVLTEVDSVNVDVEGDEDCDVLLRDMIQDNSNQSSPAESVASSNASKKREKCGKKKNKRDRTSPNINLEK